MSGEVTVLKRVAKTRKIEPAEDGELAIVVHFTVDSKLSDGSVKKENGQRVIKVACHHHPKKFI
jgi:hypothetical protein